MGHERPSRTLKMNRLRFKRRTGIFPETFAAMEAVLVEPEGAKKKSGRPAGLSSAELLLTLEFWREHRNFAHLGDDWGVHDDGVQCTVERVEAALIASGQLRLPGKKVLKEAENVFQIIAVDAAETPCERPKKAGRPQTGAVLTKTAAALIQRQEKASHPENAGRHQRSDTHVHVCRYCLRLHA